jgi:hypothetical protein
MVVCRCFTYSKTPVRTNEIARHVKHFLHYGLIQVPGSEWGEYRRSRSGLLRTRVVFAVAVAAIADDCSRTARPPGKEKQDPAASATLRTAVLPPAEEFLVPGHPFGCRRHDPEYPRIEGIVTLIVHHCPEKVKGESRSKRDSVGVFSLTANGWRKVLYVEGPFSGPLDGVRQSRATSQSKMIPGCPGLSSWKPAARV